MKTIVHLKDRKGREGIKVYEGDCDFGGVYMNRRVPDGRKYALVNEAVKEGSDVKYFYYEEI